MIDTGQILRIRIKDGANGAFTAWQEKLRGEITTSTGFVSLEIFSPQESKKPEWIIIQHFDNSSNLEAWLHSSKRKNLIKDAESLVSSYESHRVTSPYDNWFSQGPKENWLLIWKQTMLILLVLFPIVMLEIRFLMPLLGNLNTSLATFIGNIISVSLITWPCMPFCLSFLNWWLEPSSTKNHILGTLLVLALYAAEIAIFW
ncbi:MAG: hypothetical protein LLF94_08695 [Chlamydiales bacterium]|nr:hypothetical protein [Chlamydiales bacterium]